VNVKRAPGRSDRSRAGEVRGRLPRRVQISNEALGLRFRSRRGAAASHCAEDVRVAVGASDLGSACDIKNLARHKTGSLCRQVALVHPCFQRELSVRSSGTWPSAERIRPGIARPATNSAVDVIDSFEPTLGAATPLHLQADPYLMTTLWYLMTTLWAL
jgi:hypothetical protein